MTLSELLSNQHPVRTISGARTQIRRDLVGSGKRLVVIDDDPTGMQTVQGVPVYMYWSVETLRKAVASGEPVVFISVNSRSLGPADTRSLALEVGRNLREAAEREKTEVLLASRSDSTLRGHYPVEVDALLAGFGIKPDGVLIAPAFFEAGRYTVNDVQYAEQGGQIVPVHETEFARDPVFSFKNSNLKSWVEEKTKGSLRADSVRSVPLTLIRQGGPEAVARELLKASGAVPVVINGACYDDFDIFCLGLQEAERQGKSFVYRCSASFLKARGGFEDRPLLTHKEMVTGGGPGLIVVGSYVGKTSRQLQKLFDASLAEGVEIRVSELRSQGNRDIEIQRVSNVIEQKLGAATTVALYTSRDVLMSAGNEFSEAGKSIMRAVCDIVKSLQIRPAYVVAKGGITSIETAKTALAAKEAWALGQILPGVPVWRLGAESRWPGISLVVFPGNVGDDEALVRAVRTLRDNDR